MSRVTVVGGGIAGLVAAITCAEEGAEVVLHEARDERRPAQRGGLGEVDVDHVADGVQRELQGERAEHERAQRGTADRAEGGEAERDLPAADVLGEVRVLRRVGRYQVVERAGREEGEQARQQLGEAGDEQDHVDEVEAAARLRLRLRLRLLLLLGGRGHRRGG